MSQFFAAKKKEDPNLPGIDRYMRVHLYGKSWFPSVDDNGAVYTAPAGKVGRASVKARVYLSGSALVDHLNQHFPQRAIHHATAPESRALQLKAAKRGQQILNFGPAGAAPAAVKEREWKLERQELVAREFEVPSSTKILLFFPEIFDRAILKKDPRFHFKYTDNSGNPKTGYKTPCPYCGTNKFVSFDKKTGYKLGKHRSIADYRGRTPIHCFVIKCSNIECSGGSPKAGDSSDKVSDHTVQATSPLVYNNYPQELRDKYAKELYTEAEDGSGGAILFTKQLAAEILRDETNFSQLTRHMNEAHARAKAEAIASYVAFIKTQEGGNFWPDFNADNFDRLFGPPSVNTIIRIFHKAFDLIKPYLQRDLFSRPPTRSIAMDGTFRYLSRTMNDKQSTEETKCLHMIYDQYGRAISWAMAGPENDECFQRLCWHLRKRAEMLGDGHLEAVTVAYSDTCCQMLKDPTTHWITKIFPNVMRAPYRDIFHAMKKVTDATQPHHELGPMFSQLMSRSLIQYDPASISHAAKLYQKKSSSKLAIEVAKDQVLKHKAYRRKIKNYAPPKAEVETALRKAYTKIEKEDIRLKNEAQLNGEGYLSFVLSAKAGKRLGTKKEMENLLVHVCQGCCEDPFDLDTVNVAVDSDDPHSDYLRLRSTSQGESCHKEINNLVADVSIQSAELADKRLWLRLTRHNLEKDATLHKVLGIQKPKTMDWHIHEGLRQQHPALSIYKDYKFPPQIPEDYWEPIGIEYGRCKDWEAIQQELDSALQVGPAPVFGPAITVSPIQPVTTLSPVARLPATPATVQAGSSPPKQYSPQARWNRSQTPMTAYNVSVINQHLSPSTNLNAFQEKHFWDSVSYAYNYHGAKANTDNVALVAAQCFNQKHVNLVSGVGSIGLGGMIRTNHAKALLRDKGQDVQVANMGGLNPHKRKAAPVNERAILTRAKVMKLTHRELMGWSRHLNKAIQNSKQKAQAKLLECFEGKPEDYTITRE